MSNLPKGFVNWLSTINYGSLPDWLTIIAAVVTIYFGFKGILKQIRSDQSIAKMSMRTNFTFNWEVMLHEGQKFWLHQHGYFASAWWKDGSIIEKIPIFQNSGMSQAFNVVIKFIYDADSELKDQAFMKSCVSVGDEFIVANDGWVDKSIGFVKELDKIEIYYMTQAGERNLITYNTAMINGKKTIDLLSPESKVLRPEEYAQLKDVLEPTLFSKIDKN